MRLRCKIGAHRLFTPIATRPFHYQKYWHIARKIRRLEAGLIRHVREDVPDVLERRDRIEAMISFKIPT